MLGLDGNAALGVLTLLCNDFCCGFLSGASSLAFTKQSPKGHFPPKKALKHVSVLSLLRFTPENCRIRIVINSYPVTGLGAVVTWKFIVTGGTEKVQLWPHQDLKGLSQREMSIKSLPCSGQFSCSTDKPQPLLCNGGAMLCCSTHRSKHLQSY